MPRRIEWDIILPRAIRLLEGVGPFSLICNSDLPDCPEWLNGTRCKAVIEKRRPVCRQEKNIVIVINKTILMLNELREELGENMTRAKNPASLEGEVFK